MTKDKVLALITCLVMALSILTGCTSKGDAENKEVSDSSQTYNNEVVDSEIVADNSFTEVETADSISDTPNSLEDTSVTAEEPSPTTPVEEQKPFIDQVALRASLSDTLASTVDPAQRQALIDMSSRYKLLGRVYVSDDVIWCGFSGTGIEFTFQGDKLDVTILGDGACLGSADSQARFAVYINGERVIDQMVDSKEETYTIYDSNSQGNVQLPATVRIIKLSECAQSTFGIKDIEVSDGASITPTAPKTHKIEFIGDSITCGYGVDDEVKEHHFATTTEDVTKAYAYKTAELLDADYSMVSMSGWGVLSGYTSDPSQKSAEQQIPKIYDKVGYSYQAFNLGVKPQNQYWDFEFSQPDLIVINLGTNDASYVKTDVAKRIEFQDAYVAFIKKVRAYYPDANILCALGIMGADLFNPIQNAFMAYCKETGDTKVRTVKLDTQNGKYGYAADWHPTEGTHAEAAEKMAEKINQSFGWN